MEVPHECSGCGGKGRIVLQNDRFKIHEIIQCPMCKGAGKLTEQEEREFMQEMNERYGEPELCELSELEQSLDDL